MTNISLSKYYADDGQGYAEVIRDVDKYIIEYNDNDGKVFYTEDFSGKSLRYVEDAAENWALGIKKLDV